MPRCMSCGEDVYLTVRNTKMCLNCGSDFATLRRIEHKVGRVKDRLVEIQIRGARMERKLDRLLQGILQRTEGTTAIHVVAVELERSPQEEPMSVDHMPDFTLPSSSIRAVLAVVGPKLANGDYATGGSWATSDTTALPLEAIADSIATDGDGNPILDDQGRQIPVFKTFANTPLTPPEGEKVGGTVTWSAPGMADVDIKVQYGDPALGHAAITASETPEA